MSSEGKDFKILSIDGGGIKGLYSAVILQQFEDQFNCHISDHFDMLCGTSTGGLIALALSLKIPASKIVEFYQHKGPIIFPAWRRWPILSSINQTLLFGKYGGKALKEAVTGIFGDNLLAQSNNLLCIPTYSVTDGRPWVFKFDHLEGKKVGKSERDNSTRYADVAMATSAAPTFFPIVNIPHHQDRQFIDGGIWGNNPSLIGYTEALTYFVGDNKEFDRLSMLSISSLNIPQNQPVGRFRNRSFIMWRDKLFDASLIGQSNMCHYFLDQMQTNSKSPFQYTRIESPRVSSAEEKYIQLDNACQNALKTLIAKGIEIGRDYKHRSTIKTFFTHPKTYQTF